MWNKSRNKTMKEETINYETALRELESLVKRVEDPDRSFEEVMEDIRRGRELVVLCREMLRVKEEEML